jgi:protein-S-isoprenylcysteine O-methyltransferase Ste14
MKGLARRALRGWVFFQAFLAILLCLAAGTLSWWQGWAYWLVFGCATGAVSAYFLKHDPQLVERRMAVGPTAEKRTTQKIIQAVTSVLLFALYIVAGLDQRFAWSDVPLWGVIAGNALVAISFLMLFVVFRQNSFAAATVELQPGQRVITNGLYGYVRHPMYTMSLLLFCGTALALGSYAAMAVALLLAVMIAARLVDEERFLCANLAGYEDYRRQVRYRLIPGLW